MCSAVTVSAPEADLGKGARAVPARATAEADATQRVGRRSAWTPPSCGLHTSVSSCHADAGTLRAELAKAGPRRVLRSAGLTDASSARPPWSPAGLLGASSLTPEAGPRIDPEAPHSPDTFARAVWKPPSIGSRTEGSTDRSGTRPWPSSSHGTMGTHMHVCTLPPAGQGFQPDRHRQAHPNILMSAPHQAFLDTYSVYPVLIGGAWPFRRHVGEPGTAPTP